MMTLIAFLFKQVNELIDQIRNTTVRLVIATLVLGMIGCAAAQQDERSQVKPLVVFLVRHAEKVDASDDPKLSQAGRNRALELARMLRDSQIQHIHSTDYVRTRNTAQPVAERLKLKIDLYNSRDLPTMVKKLKQAGGRHLVVGHSNTTPQLVKLLGGKPGEPINESGEYDRIYVLALDKNQKTSTMLLRYGKPFQKQKGNAENVIK